MLTVQSVPSQSLPASWVPIQNPRLDARLMLVHESALAAAHAYKRAESLLVDALIAVERERIFVKLGYSSLFLYEVESLGLSESIAYSAISVARKSREVPALHAAARSGEISLSKAKKITSVLTNKNQTEWLERAKTLTSYKLEKEVARVNPRTATPERAVFVGDKRMSLSLGVSEELMLDLRRAQNQMSRIRGSAASLEDKLAEMTRFYLKHKDPIEKAKRIIAKTQAPIAKGMEATPSHQDSLQKPTKKVETRFLRPVIVPQKNHRVPVPAAVAHQVRVRDQNKCQFPLPDGTHCHSSRWVDLHHVKPVSRGGLNMPENLITLCRAHHQELHHSE